MNKSAKALSMIAAAAVLSLTFVSGGTPPKELGSALAPVANPDDVLACQLSLDASADVINALNYYLADNGSEASLDAIKTALDAGVSASEAVAGPNSPDVVAITAEIDATAKQVRQELADSALAASDAYMVLAPLGVATDTLVFTCGSLGVGME